MKSLTLQNCSKFIVNNSLTLLNGEIKVGEIVSAGSIIIEKESFKSYDCELFITVNEDILVRDIQNGELFPVAQYKKGTKFKCYYSENKKLLFIDAPTAISKRFLKVFKENHSEKIECSRYDIDFGRVGEFTTTARGIYFQVDEEQVDRKNFFGTGVDQNAEVAQAISEEQATYLLAEIDLEGKSRTIGFSKKGALVIYNTPNDLQVEFPYLQLAFAAIKKIQRI